MKYINVSVLWRLGALSTNWALMLWRKVKTWNVWVSYSHWLWGLDSALPPIIFQITAQCVLAHERHCTPTRGSQLLTSMWIWGVKLRSSGLAASIFTYWAIIGPVVIVCLSLHTYVCTSMCILAEVRGWCGGFLPELFSTLYLETGFSPELGTPKFS